MVTLTLANCLGFPLLAIMIIIAMIVLTKAKNSVRKPHNYNKNPIIIGQEPASQNASDQNLNWWVFVVTVWGLFIAVATLIFTILQWLFPNPLFWHK